MTHCLLPKCVIYPPKHSFCSSAHPNRCILSSALLSYSCPLGDGMDWSCCCLFDIKAMSTLSCCDISNANKRPSLSLSPLKFMQPPPTRENGDKLARGRGHFLFAKLHLVEHAPWLGQNLGFVPLGQPVYRGENKGLHVVARNFFLLLLNLSAWLCLGPAWQDIQTCIYASVLAGIGTNYYCPMIRIMIFKKKKCFCASFANAKSISNTVECH